MSDVIGNSLQVGPGKVAALKPEATIALANMITGLATAFTRLSEAAIGVAAASRGPEVRIDHAVGISIKGDSPSGS